MEVHDVVVDGINRLVLVDDEMRIVLPAFKYLEHMRLKDKAPNTLKAYAQDLKTYWAFLVAKGYSFEEATPTAINEFKAYLRSGDARIVALHVESVRSGRTINRILGTVKGLYLFCEDFKLGPFNPVLMRSTVRHPGMFKGMLHHTRSDNKTPKGIFKVKENPRKVRILTPDEAEAIRSSLRKTRDRVLFDFLYHTGARIQEALDLEIAAVPVPDSSQMVGILEDVKSKGKYRDIYVPMFVIEELDDFILNERSRIDTGHDYVFVSEHPAWRGKQLTYSAIYDTFKRVQGETGIEFSFHDIRHTFNTDLAEDGIDVAVRQLLMGHAHASTTELYTHLSRKKTIEVLSGYWERSVMAR